MIHFVLEVHMYCHFLSLTRVATLVNHQHVGSDANHPAHLALELAIGQPDGSWRSSVRTGDLAVNACSVSSSGGVLRAAFFHGLPAVIFPAVVLHSLFVLWLWSTW